MSEENGIHGERVQGLWVFGLYKVINNVRFYFVENRATSTLLPIIGSHVEHDSYIVSDEWRAYCRLNDSGYRQQTVNHSRNFVNSRTGFHTRLYKEPGLMQKVG